MSSWELNFSETEFSGVAPLFPLPDAVLFPHVLQPLHIFEARYVEMVQECLAGDKLIAMGLLQKGWESEYHGRPPISPHVCLGRVVTHTEVDDGKYNIVLAGLVRASVSRELPSKRSFRQIELEVVEDQYPTDGTEHRSALRSDLLSKFRQLVPKQKAVIEQLDHLTSQDVSLGALTDIVGYSLPLDLSVKMRLLSNADVDRRAHILLDTLSSQQARFAGQRPFPPPFSNN